MAQITPVPLPLMGEGVHEATIVRWLKKVGEAIKENEPLLEVSTDKVDTEITSPTSGYLIAILSEQGVCVEVEKVMGYIADRPDQALPESIAKDILKPSKQRKELKGDSEQDFLETAFSSDKNQGGLASHSLSQRQLMAESSKCLAGFVKSSPLVRKKARDLGIDLSQVRGTGLHGRILAEDLSRYYQKESLWVAQQAKALAQQREAELELLLKTEIKEEGEYLEGVLVKRQAMSKMRRLTAEHTLKSVRCAPHVTTTFEVDLHKVDEFRQQVRGDAAKKIKLSYTAFFLEAVVKALVSFPDFNSAVDGSDILYRKDIHLGCAVALNPGLIVPVIRHADKLSLFELANSLNDLVQKARDRSLSPQDIVGGTFTITNPGVFGCLHSQPIIHQPQSAILSIGSVVSRPVVEKGKILIRPLSQVGLTFDHRAADGEGAAYFLSKIKDHLENYPELSAKL